MKYPFYTELMEAKVTIEIGGHKITMRGELEPPMIDRKIGDNIFSYERDINGINKPDIPLDSWITLKLKTDDKVSIEQFKWEIPIVRKAWIEND